MKFHEALRGILRLYGFELMEDETGRLFELLRKYRAFEELPCLWDALRLVMYSSRTASGSAEALSDGARLYRLSLLPESTGYLRALTPSASPWSGRGTSAGRSPPTLSTPSPTRSA